MPLLELELEELLREELIKLDETLELIRLEELLERGALLELGALLDLGALELTPPHTKPPWLDGWVVQVLLEMQLLLFSQPQPLVVVTHDGYTVPYQLHWHWPLLPELLATLEATLETGTLEATLETATLDATLEGATLLLLGATLLLELLTITLLAALLLEL